MRRSLAVLALVALAAGLATATPASATCMEHVDKWGVTIYSCSPPGGPVTTYVCAGDVCVPISGD